MLFKSLLQQHEAGLSSLVTTYRESRKTADREAVEEYLDRTWQPNVTLIDFEKTPSGPPQPPHVAWSPLDLLSDFLAATPPNTRNRQQIRGALHTYCETFDLVGKMLFQIRQSRQVVIGLVLGEMTNTLEKLRHGLLRDDQQPTQNMDPRKFPNQFDSIDLSNVPDYVGGSLTTFLHTVPTLKSQGLSRIRSYVLRNPGAWATHDEFLSEWLLLASRQQITSHFRTALTSDSLAKEKAEDGIGTFLGMGGAMYLMMGMEWERIASTTATLTPEARMERAELERWLHAHFFKLCLPYPREPFGVGMVYAPLSMATFFHLVAHVATLGYPLHWLAGTLAALCSGMLANTRAGPPTASITNGAKAKRVLSPAQISIAPFLAEFRTLLALWEPVLGVPIVLETGASLLPDRNRNNIRKFLIKFPTMSMGFVDNHRNPVSTLVFKAASLKLTTDKTMWHLLNERAGNNSSTARTARTEPLVHIVSSFMWTTKTSTATFWMGKELVENLVAKGGWEAWIYQTDTWRPVVGPVSLGKGGAVTEVEAWC